MPDQSDQPEPKPGDNLVDYFNKISRIEAGGADRGDAGKPAPEAPSGLLARPGKPGLKEQPTHTDETRRYIAWGLLILLALMILATLVSFTFGWLTIPELKELPVLITPVFTLAGTALGFYFGAHGDAK